MASPAFGFAVWAPNAESVTVTGEFNDWDTAAIPCAAAMAASGNLHPRSRPGSGVQVPHPFPLRGYQQLKADPYAFYCETPPKSASVVWDIARYSAGCRWMECAQTDWSNPIAIYEVHLNPGSAAPWASRSPTASWPSSWWST